jgi:hypothetical protein
MSAVRYYYTVEQIDRMLITQMERLARELAPDGERHGAEWVALNPGRSDTRKGSFSINLRSGVWKDFAAGQGGKALPGLSLVAYLATEGDFHRAIVWAKRWLGIEGEAPDPAKAAAVAAQVMRNRAEEKAERDKKRGIAFALWLESTALMGDDPASLYLKARGIDPRELEGGVFPKSLVFHPRLTHPSQPGRFPALVACQSLEGQGQGFGGIHRIYLKQEGGIWVKAFGKKDSKCVLGYVAGATTRIARGKSGKALNHAPKGEWIHATEGVEDGLALAIAMPGARVVAAYSIGALGLMRFPETIGGVVVVADNDTGNVEAERNLELRCLDLADRYEVKVARMPDAFKDVNDVLMGKRRDSKKGAA